MRPLLFTLLILVSNTMSHAKAGISVDTLTPTPDKIIVFKSIESVNLSLHIFNPKNHKIFDTTPVILFFFGGGWTGGTPKQFYEQARYFADKGIVAISAEYRVFKTHGTTPFDALTDAKSAIRWVRQHAQELGINPDKIVASGGSAGGHLAACTELIGGYENTREDLSISSKPNAMILYNPVLDTTEKGYGLDKVGKENKTLISPIHHIRAGVVPTIVFHGKADKTVPFENAQILCSLLKEAKNDCQLESYEGKGHGFFNGEYFHGDKADITVYADIIQKSYSFLDSRLIDPKK
jgi:acetyl esterase/lipase